MARGGGTVHVERAAGDVFAYLAAMKRQARADTAKLKPALESRAERAL